MEHLVVDVKINDIAYSEVIKAVIIDDEERARRVLKTSF